MAYDARCVKIGKPIKVMAATILDKAKRRAFIRSYVKIAESELRSGNRKESK